MFWGFSLPPTLAAPGVAVQSSARLWFWLLLGVSAQLLLAGPLYASEHAFCPAPPLTEEPCSSVSGANKGLLMGPEHGGSQQVRACYPHKEKYMTLFQKNVTFAQ